jgi:hypothetical protein
MVNKLAPEGKMAAKLEDKLRQVRERDGGRLADIQKGYEKTRFHFAAMPFASR